MASRPCPGCEALRLHLAYPWRVVAFAAALQGVGVPQRHIIDGVRGTKVDVVLSRQSYPRRTFGGVTVACACEDPGLKRIGGSTALLWGRNAKSLEEFVERNEDALSPIVLLGLVPGTRMTGGAAKRVKESLEASGHRVYVVGFEDRTVVRVDPRAYEPLQVLLGRTLDL